MRVQTLFLIDVRLLRRHLKEEIAEETKKLEQENEKYALLIEQREAAIDERQRQLIEEYFPFIQQTEKIVRQKYGMRPIPSRLAGTGENSFVIIVDEDVHRELSKASENAIWWKNLTSLIYTVEDEDFADIRYEIKISDLPMPRQPDETRLLQLSGYLNWLDQQPDNGNYLISSEQTKFMGFKIEPSSPYKYQLLPD